MRRPWRAIGTTSQFEDVSDYTGVARRIGVPAPDHSSGHRTMKNLQQALQRPRDATEQERFPILWSEQRKDALRRTANRQLPAAVPIDIELALPLLRCAEGDFATAETEIVQVLIDRLATCARDNESFISALNALFTVQRLDLVAAMLRDRYGFARPFRLLVQPNAAGVGQVVWQIGSTQESGEHLFIFDAAVYKSDDTRLEILAFQWEFPLFAHYSGVPAQESGKTVINRRDVGHVPGIAYCDARPDYFLVPDCIFVPTRGYQYAREHFRKRNTRWADRKPLAFWRGTTTGIPERANDWTSLPRTKLCRLASHPAHTHLFDVGFSSVAQFDGRTVAEEIRNAGLMRGFVSWEEWDHYKYHIVIDGNSSPWSNLFQQLLTGSPILRIESSRGLVQWFYDELIPWDNYVPVAPDMSDLVDKIKWLNRNDGVAEVIGRRGLELANRLSYAREMTRSVPVISSAFCYFNGRSGDSGPFGRPLPHQGYE